MVSRFDRVGPLYPPRRTNDLLRSLTAAVLFDRPSRYHMAMKPAVEVRALSYKYGPVTAVNDVTFDVAGGEVFGILGPNGAGKTTTLECVLGLRKPASGTVTVGGFDIVADPGAVRGILGAQLQSTQLQDKLTPRQAIGFFRSFYRKGLPVDQLLNRFRLVEKADATFDSLSAGQRQRVGLALAFVNDPIGGDIWTNRPPAWIQVPGAICTV